MAAKSSKATARGAKGETEEPASEVLSFEGALEQLETTVGRLEEGEMPLEEALALFEKGVALSRQCTETLEAAEKRIEILVAEDGDPSDEWASEPFGHEEDESELDD